MERRCLMCQAKSGALSRAAQESRRSMLTVPQGPPAGEVSECVGKTAELGVTTGVWGGHLSHFPHMNTPTTSRRRFLATAGAAFAAPSFIPNLRAASPNGKLRHVSFGASGQARGDLDSIAGSPHVEVFAVVDVDKKNWEGITKTWPQAKLYQDWREFMAKEAGNFDCANVSTPDHMHGPIASALMNAGKHVYGEKPLTHNLRECRHLTTLAREKGLMTQMGIQVSS